MKCYADGCERPVDRRCLCTMHYVRWRRHGDWDIRLKEHGSGRFINNGYIMIRVGKKFRYEHILIAEKALGKPLPKGAEVHHVNENRGDNRPENLVICPSKGYHGLIHRRMKELAIG